MAITYLPDKDHVVRYVPWARLRKDEDNNVIGLLGAAFRLREGEEYLSATWVEFFEGEREENLGCAVRAIRASDIDVRPQSGFAVGNVALIKARCLADKNRLKIRIIHEKADDNPAHAALRLWPRDNELLLELLAETDWAETILNKKISEACPDETGCRCARHRRKKPD
jgi:hypothetical protein